MRYIYFLPLFFIFKRVLVYLAVRRNKVMGPLFQKLYEVSELTTNSLGYWSNLKVINALGHNTRLPFKDVLGELEYRLNSGDYEKAIKIISAVDLAESWNKASKTFYFGFYYKIFSLSNIFLSFNILFWNYIKIMGFGYIVSLYNLKFGIFKDWPVLNVASNYLLRQVKIYLGLDYKQLLDWLPTSPDIQQQEIDLAIKKGTEDRENELVGVN